MASTALVVADASASAIILASGYDRAQVELVKNTVAVGATDMELALFLQTAKHRGLDVFARQLHFVKRKTRRQDPVTGQWGEVMVGSMQTGIDGFRLIADRTGKYHGQDEPEYEYEEGPGRRLRRASVRVYRSDIPRPFVGTAYWAEYAEVDNDGKPRSMWKRMPHVMLAKCAEAIALRKAFPENLSGLYTDDEMPTIEGETVAVHDSPPTRATGTVTRMPDRSQRAETSPAAADAAATPAPSAQEIPPADVDAGTLRTWLGHRLAFATKSWTGVQMKLACDEVANALQLGEGVVTPRTLGDYLPRYRDAIASAGSPPPTGGAQEHAPDDHRAPSPDSEAAGTHGLAYQAIIELLSDRGIANDDGMIQDLCAAVSAESPAGVRYDWLLLTDDEQTIFLDHLKSLLAGRAVE